MNGIAITLLILMIIFFIFIILSSICLSMNIFIEKYDTPIKDIELKNNKEDNIKVFVLGTSLNRELYNNISSLKQYNYNYEVICIGEKFGGWRWRVQKYLNCIKEHREKYGDNSIIVFIDGYDAFACSSSEGLYNKFLSYIKNKPECGILAGIEKGLPGGKQYGNIDLWWRYHNLNKQKYSHTTCNAGFIMGFSKHLEDLYQYIYDKEYDDDQVGLREYTKEYPDKIYYDIESIIVYNRILTEIDNKESHINLPHFRHYPTFGKWGKFFGVSFDVDVQKYIKDNYSIEPIESKKSLESIKFVLGFSSVGFIITILLFVPQVL